MINGILDDFKNNPNGKGLRSLTTDDFLGSLSYVGGNLPEISRLVSSKHKKYIASWVANKKGSRKNKNRAIIFGPTVNGTPFVKDKVVRDLPGIKMGSTQASLSIGGVGGRFWGIGLGEKKAGRIDTYQLLRVDYHRSKIRHEDRYTNYFDLGGREFHYHVSRSAAESRGR